MGSLAAYAGVLIQVIGAWQRRHQLLVALATFLWVGLPIVQFFALPSNIVVGVPRVVDGDSLEV